MKKSTGIQARSGDLPLCRNSNATAVLFPCRLRSASFLQRRILSGRCRRHPMVRVSITIVIMILFSTVIVAIEVVIGGSNHRRRRFSATSITSGSSSSPKPQPHEQRHHHALELWNIRNITVIIMDHHRCHRPHPWDLDVSALGFRREVRERERETDRQTDRVCVCVQLALLGRRSPRRLQAQRRHRAELTAKSATSATETQLDFSFVVEAHRPLSYKPCSRLSVQVFEGECARLQGPNPHSPKKAVKKSQKKHKTKFNPKP